MTDKKLVKKTNSKEPIRGYSGSKWSASVTPNMSFDAVLEMVDADPVTSGAISHYVDKSTEGGWAVVKRDTGLYDKAFEDKLVYEHKLDIILRKVFYVGKLFNNVFLEVVRNVDNSLKDLNVLDSTNIEPTTKPNGDPTGYKSKISHPVTGRYAEWTTDEIIWFKFSDRDGGYGHTDVETLWNTLLQKNYIQRFVTWLWQTGQYRVIHNFKGNDKVVKDFEAYNKKNEADYRQPFMVGGEYIVSTLRDMKETESLVELLKYLDGQILILLRIPPIDAGIPDASGRSNSDAQSNNLVTHVKSRKKVVKIGMNDLFTLINKGNDSFVFSPTDKFEFKLLLEQVQMMKASGFKDEVITEFLRDNGVVFQEAKLFNDVETEAETPNNPRELDTMPSRQGKSEGEANEKQDEVSTREDQLVKKSTDDSYEKSEQWRDY